MTGAVKSGKVSAVPAGGSSRQPACLVMDSTHRPSPAVLCEQWLTSASCLFMREVKAGSGRIKKEKKKTNSTVHTRTRTEKHRQMKNVLRHTSSGNVSSGFQSIRDKCLPGEMIKAKVTEKALNSELELCLDLYLGSNSVKTRL